MEKELSCGFLVKLDGKFLACHSSGRKLEPCTYDIAKGHCEEGETHFEAAKRELKEEAGIDLDHANFEYEIIDFGVQKYIKTKDLHVYMLDIKQVVEPLKLECTTFFEINGKTVPEVDGYTWTTDISLYFRSLQNIFNRLKEQKLLNF